MLVSRSCIIGKSPHDYRISVSRRQLPCCWNSSWRVCDPRNKVLRYIYIRRPHPGSQISLQTQWYRKSSKYKSSINSSWGLDERCNPRHHIGHWPDPSRSCDLDMSSCLSPSSPACCGNAVLLSACHFRNATSPIPWNEITDV